MVNGIADLGPTVREFKQIEIKRFEKKYKQKPVYIKIAIADICLVAHKDNPIVQRGLTPQEIDAIYSSTRNKGYKTDITKWSDLGLKGDYQNQPITLFGRNSASGFYGYFKKAVLAKGDFKETVKEQPGLASIIHHVSKNKFAIGYSSISYISKDTLPIPIIINGKIVIPNAENMQNGSYPFSRFMTIVPKPKPDQGLKDYLKFMLSDEGRKAVKLDGYVNLTKKMAEEQIKIIDSL